MPLVFARKSPPWVVMRNRRLERKSTADKVIVRYRERLMEWQQRGWRIDVDAVESRGEDVVFAIPCPARRQHKRWALRPIPLLAAE